MIDDRFKDPKHIKWAKKVKERDNFTCQICKKDNVYLNSHHLNSFDIFIKERYDINNGITLCFQCHDFFHSVFKKGRNTRFQFKQFLEIINIIRLVAKKQV